MFRPARKHAHLTQKIANNEAQSQGRKLGKRTKRWRKWLETYRALAEGTTTAES